MTLRVLVRIISLSLVSISNYPYLTKIINFLNPEFHPNYAHAKQQIVLDGG
jgi:ubiquitin-protein ligase